MKNLNEKSISNKNNDRINQFKVLVDLENDVILLSAVCQFEIPYDQLAASLFVDQKKMILSKSFCNLNTRDKILVLKSAMHTHYNLFDGEIPGYGEIKGYQLFYNSNLFVFDLKGRLISDNVLV